MAKGRKILYDQDKIKELRMQVVMDSLMVFSDNKKSILTVKKWSRFRKDLLMKYAPRVLPQLVAGKDDDSDLIPQPLLGGISIKSDNRNNRNRKAPNS